MPLRGMHRDLGGPIHLLLRLGATVQLIDTLVVTDNVLLQVLKSTDVKIVPGWRG